MSTPLRLDHVLFSGAAPAFTIGDRRAQRPVPPTRALHAPRRPLPRAAGPVDPLAEWLLQQIGVDAQAYRGDSMRRRIPACVRHLRATGPWAARALLQRQPQLIPGALNTVLIGVTEFFRDEGVFACLRDVVLPELLRTRDIVRIYSAGVSTGEELFSVAMLLAEMRALGRCELLGLDCRAQAIAQARSGEFTAEQLLRLDPQRRERHFQRRGARWLISDAIRARIEWRVGNVFQFAEAAQRDLILFRNIAIYLNPQPAAAVWSRLCDSLTPGGFLVAGRAEQPAVSLPLTRVLASVYRRH